MMLGRGVRGVCGSCLRPRQGVLAPDVDSKGLPLTEPLPYIKIGTERMKKITTKKKKKKRRRKRRTNTKAGRCKTEGEATGGRDKSQEEREGKRESLDTHS